MMLYSLDMDSLFTYSPLSAPKPPRQVAPTSVQKNSVVEDAPKDEEAWATAQKFEASFIAQMLSYSGLAKALTAAGGEDVASFSQFYMESIAEDITESGGFGIAEKIYKYIEKKGGDYGDLGRL